MRITVAVTAMTKRRSSVVWAQEENSALSAIDDRGYKDSFIGMRATNATNKKLKSQQSLIQKGDESNSVRWRAILRGDQ
jgi:hypothetical protein